MDEDVGVKAPVTRLRRRLSVESEDVKSPATPSTPTKKRGGRLAAKPQLELIDENVPETAPKKTTRKSIAREIVEPIEEKTVTPSRRSARVRSASSIVSEIAVNVNSPRAKRAARRTSLAGSDNEASVTPVRQTRRTRNNSTSSLEQQASGVGISNEKIATQVKDIITEEPETSAKESNSEPSPKNSSLRKSPRINKNNKSQLANSTEDTEKPKSEQQEDVTDAKLENGVAVVTVPLDIKKAKKESNDNDKKNISLFTTKLLDELNVERNTVNSTMNKSTSVLEDTNNIKNKKQRTKSWTTISVSSDGSFYSDIEGTKQKKNKKNISSGDGDKSEEKEISISLEKKQSQSLDKEISPELELASPIKINLGSFNKAKNVDERNEINLDSNTQLSSPTETLRLFEKAPTELQSLVFIEDSDSNTGSIGKTRENDGDDQCVPVITHSLQTGENNTSQEPMDIDETIPENMTVFSDKNDSQHREDKSSKHNLTGSIIGNISNLSQTNKSKRKSSVSNSEQQIFEKSSNENKSTLILSQIKDVSSTEIMNVEKSKNVSNENLSKSVTMSDTTKDTCKKGDKKNLSLDYCKTSTPLQQKSLKKLGMPMNTSIITSNVEKKELESSKNKSKDDMSLDLLDNEADDASDYESGDSRDEDEKQYERENEIVEKGETLESDEDFSDDTDYEKDSFVVSSNEEDEELLSGSGDDLSMSDKELKMTKKSKQKYNERKLKEQKKASKEMYAARHKLDESNQSTKSEKTKHKKSKQKQVISSESEGESPVGPKKHNRMRLDSSQDISVAKSDSDETIGKKKKKSKRLSDSVCEIAIDEKEITIINESVSDKIDPLKQIKLEPKTPQKDFNITTVPILDGEDVEEVKIDENVSMVRSNETSDPLQCTAMEDEEFSDDSENLEIVEDFDSLLNDLNNLKGKKTKISDISLNLNKKKKQKEKEPIVDQLNLTQVKTIKKDKQPRKKVEPSHNLTETKKPVETTEEVSSDSIDMRLLFPEDSNDSHVNADKFESENKCPIMPKDDFIPLKKTEGQTNIHSSTDLSMSQNHSILNDSKKSKKKRESSLCIPDNIELPREQNNAFVDFFIDTTGNHKSMEVSIHDEEPPIIEIFSEKKKKKNKKSLSSTEVDVIASTTNKIETQDEQQEELTMTSEKKKKKIKSIQSLDNTEIQDHEEEPAAVAEDVNQSGKKKNKNKNISAIEFFVDNDDNVPTKSLNLSLPISAAEKKKNKKLSQSLIVEHEADNEVEETPIEILTQSAKKKNKKNKKLLNNSAIIDTEPTIEENVNIEAEELSVLTQSKKKNKNNKSMNISSIETENEQVVGTPVQSVAKSSGKKKNKNNKSVINDSATDMGLQIDETEEQAAVSFVPVEAVEVTHSEKKKHKKNKNSANSTINETSIHFEEVDVACAKSLNISLPTSGIEKKKKNKNLSQSLIVEPAAENQVQSVEDNISKKRKRKSSANLLIENIDEEIKVINTSMTEKSLTPKSQNKKRKVSHSKDEDINNSEEINVTNASMPEKALTPKSQNKKRKDSHTKEEDMTYSEEIIVTSDMMTEKALTPKSQNKKRKNSHSNEEGTANSEDFVPKDVSEESNKKDKIKNKTNKNKLQMKSEISEEVIEQEVTVNKKRNKKRKERDDDDVTKISKVLKQNSFDKVHVPRLPTSVVNELDEFLESKRTAISTTKFTVEETKRRKNKPSNYLEQSVYLNETPVKKKNMKSINNPKVLPFIPTASTSDNGFTSTFKINTLQQETQFVAQANNVTNFKHDYMNNRRTKKIGALERYRKLRNVNMSKF